MKASPPKAQLHLAITKNQVSKAKTDSIGPRCVRVVEGLLRPRRVRFGCSR